MLASIIAALYPEYEFLVLESSTNRHTFLADCQASGKYNAIQGIYRHNTCADWIGIFDEELIAGLPASLKVIGHNGAGYGTEIPIFGVADYTWQQ